MTGKSVVFYSIINDFQSVAVKLCEKFYETGSSRVLLLCANENKVREIDTKLWTYSKLSFIPHGSKFSVHFSNAEYCKIWISNKIEFVNKPDCLMHCGNIQDDDLSQFTSIIDIFNSDQRERAMKRADLYHSLRFDTQKIWLQETGGWKKSETL